MARKKKNNASVLSKIIDNVTDYAIASLPLDYTYVIIMVDANNNMLVTRNIDDGGLEEVVTMLLEPPDTIEFTLAKSNSLH
jgi:hypothetical protein